MCKAAPPSRSQTGALDSARAWCTVAAAFLAGFVVFGIIYSFGVFLEPMAGELGVGRGAASALFSIAGVSFYMLGSLTGPLSDRLGPRIVVLAGAIVMGAALVLTAFIERLWVGYVTYGIGLGFGAACAYVPTLAVVGGWFASRRNTALGIAAAGTGCGMLAVPPLAAVLIERYGWRLADIILGLAVASLLIVSAALTAPAPVAGVAQRRLGRILRSFEFVMLYVSWVLATTALFVPLVFLPAFAVERGASQVAASALVSLLGGMSILGRVGIGALGNRIGTLRLFKLAVFVMAASYGLWLSFPAYHWLAAFAAILGLAYGIRIALMPSVLIEFFGARNLGGLLGIFFTASGVSAVLGPLLAGLIVDLTGGYHWGIVFALAAGMAGFAAVIPVRLARMAPGVSGSR